MTTPPNHGRRVLLLGGALQALAKGPLKGAHLEQGGLERLIGVGASDAELIVIDADAWDPPALAAGIEALTRCPAPPPVLLVGAHLPTAVVRNLLRLERSDVLDAPYSKENIAAALGELMAPPVAAVAPTPSGTMARCWAVTGAVGGSGATTLAIEI